MAKIKKIIAREILDSRGYPTVESIVELSDFAVGVASVPSGLSVSRHEAVELRDGDQKRYSGRGVLKCLENILTVLAPRLIGKEAGLQKQLDEEMIIADGTSDKVKLGANSILSLSCAIVKAHAVSQKIPLYQYIASLAGSNIHQFSIPTPMFNILNGGKHGGGNIDFQEFKIVPPKANPFSTSLRIGVEIYYALKEVIESRSAVPLVGDEGGYAPLLYANTDALKLLEDAIARTRYKLGLDVFFSLDIAASYIKKGSAYKIKDKPVALDANDLLDFYITLNEQYHLLSLEDPFSEDDWDHWKKITAQLGKETLIVGDDLISTNKDRLQKAIDHKACNTVIIKPNQAGTVTETIDTVKTANSGGIKIVVSHRSGETNDDFIADFAVGVNADYVKFGAPARGERVAKYNRLLEIEHELS